MAAALSLIAAATTLVPYWLAAQAAKPDLSFSGFLINPQDGFSYLAKMRQGVQGAWGFVLPYASDPGSPAFLFFHYLTLGHLSRVLGVPPLQMYHAARLCGTLLMYLAAYAVFERLLADQRARWGAYLLALFGSGLGWLGLPLGLWGNDVLIPEAVPWFSALTNAHFPWACAALLGAFHALASPTLQLPRRLALAGACGFALALLQPFAMLTVAAVGAGWLLVEGWDPRRSPGSRLRGIVRSDSAGVLAGALLGSLPILLYDLWITQAQPALHQWSVQNRTPSPSLLESALGFGLPLVLAALGAWQRRDAGRRPLLIWFAVGLLLVYLPFDLQRRMLLGLFFPLAGLAGLGMAWLAERRLPLFAGLALALVLGIPSNLVVAAAGVVAAGRGEASVTVSHDERAAYDWLAREAQGRPLVLAGATSGNRLPAFADVRVVYGHPFETPDAAHNLAVVEMYFRSAADPDATLASLRARGVDYVLVGPEERRLGPPAWLHALAPAFQAGTVAVYRVPGMNCRLCEAWPGSP